MYDLLLCICTKNKCINVHLFLFLSFPLLIGDVDEIERMVVVAIAIVVVV